MKKVFLIMSMVLLVFTSAFAQEKAVGDLSVKLGVMSWAEIQSASGEKTTIDTEEFQSKMAKSMLEMHGGGSNDMYHVMVMISEKSTDKDLEHAEVEVTAVSMAGPEEIMHKLEPMHMDKFSGYGEFFKLKLKGPYVFKINIKTYSRTYNTEIERTIL